MEDTTHVSPIGSCICGCGGGACIPQREFSRQTTDPLTEEELQEMIPFSVNGRCGYPLWDALKRQYTGLDGRDDKVFVGFKSSISLRLEVRLARQKDSMITSRILFAVAAVSVVDKTDPNVDLEEGTR